MCKEDVITRFCACVCLGAFLLFIGGEEGWWRGEGLLLEATVITTAAFQ